MKDYRADVSFANNFLRRLWWRSLLHSPWYGVRWTPLNTQRHTDRKRIPWHYSIPYFVLKFAPCLFFVYSCVCLCVCIWWASVKVRLVVKSSACSTMTYAVGLCSTTTYAVLWHIMYAVLQHMQYYQICCMQYYNICKHVCIHVSMLKGFHGSYFLVWSRNVSLWFGQRNASFWFGLCIMQCPLLVWSTSLFLVKECLILVWYYRNVSFWFDQANASFWFDQANVYLFWPGNTSLWFCQEKASLRLLYSQRANGYNILYCTS